MAKSSTVTENPDFPHPDEEFMEIVGYPNYLVSTYGRVYSVRSRKFMKFQTQGNIPRVPVSANSQVISLPLPPTVLTSFGHKPIRRNAVPSFRDGDSNNCALSNLEWV